VYCEYCKKKFANVNTYKTHVASAKHLQEVKRVQEESAGRVATAMSSPAASRPSSSLSVNRSASLQEEDGAELAEALKAADQAGTLEKQGKYRKAVLLYWKAAKGFARPGYLRDLVSALTACISLLERSLSLICKDEGEAEGDSGDGLLPTQAEAEQLLQQARSALGRTMLAIDHRAAAPLFVTALHRFFAEEDLARLEEVASTSLTRSLQEGDAIIQALLLRGRRTPRDQLYTLVTDLLAEAAGVSSLYQGNPMSVALLSLAHAFAQALDRPLSQAHHLSSISRIYDGLGLSHLASDALFLAATLSSPDPSSAGLLREALVFALLASDSVRCKRLEVTLVEGNEEQQARRILFLSLPLSPPSPSLTHTQLILTCVCRCQFLVEFSVALRTCHWAWFQGIHHRLKTLETDFPLVSRLAPLLSRIDSYT